MGRYLIIGDSHIPRRARDISEHIYNKLAKITEEKLFDYTFFTGDLIKAAKFIDFLKSKTEKDLFMVIGNMDYFDGNRDAPVYHSLDIEFPDGDQLKIGLTHGAQIEPRGDHRQLEALAIKKKYNILISGHTHHEEIFLTKKGILLMNPGSVTGAWSFVASGIPSFIVLNINQNSKEIELGLFQLDKRARSIRDIKSYYILKNNQIQSRF